MEASDYTIVLAFFFYFDLGRRQLDHDTAFTNTGVEEEMRVQMASGYEKCDKGGVPMVMRLLKIPYGLL